MEPVQTSTTSDGASVIQRGVIVQQQQPNSATQFRLRVSENPQNPQVSHIRYLSPEIGPRNVSTVVVSRLANVPATTGLSDATDTRSVKDTVSGPSPSDQSSNIRVAPNHATVRSPNNPPSSSRVGVIAQSGNGGVRARIPFIVRTSQSVSSPFYPSAKPGSLRPPPSYSSLQNSVRGIAGHSIRSIVRGAVPPQFRALRFAPPMRAPPPSPRALAGEHARPVRDFRDFSAPSSGTNGDVTKSAASADTLAKISELAEITRASIPMPPLEDDQDIVPLPSTPSRDTMHTSEARRDGNILHRDLMPPPPVPRGGSPVPRKEDRLTLRDSPSPRDAAFASSASKAGAVLGIQVEVLSSLSPVPPPSNGFHRSRFPAIHESNLGFVNFAGVVAYLSSEEPPLNPLEIESSKDVLISIFGPKMTLYRCGGCESTFIFRTVFSDHFYRGIVPYRLRCTHCKDTLTFNNICQVKDHVRSHGFKIESCRGFTLTVGESQEEIHSISPLSKAPAPLILQSSRPPSTSSESENIAQGPTSQSADQHVPQRAENHPGTPDVRARVPLAQNQPNLGSHISRALEEALGPSSQMESPPDARRSYVPSEVSRPVGSGIPSSYQHLAPRAGVSDMQRQALRTSLQNALNNNPQLAGAGESGISRLRQMVMDKPRMQSLLKKATGGESQMGPPPGMSRFGQTISVGQILEREMSRAPTTTQSSFDITRQSSPGIVCPFCSARFDGQSGMTHHYQRCKDVTRAAVELRCPECRVVCCNVCSYEAHKLIHKVKRSQASMANVCCPECGIRLKHPDDIVAHVERRCVHWCRILCSSYNCTFMNCRYHSTGEDEFLIHVAQEHGELPNGRNVCPVCRVQLGNHDSDMVRHLRAPGSLCRARLLGQKTHFFAYRCHYCPEKEAPLFETKAAMRDHILTGHPENPARPSSLISLLTESTVEPSPLKASSSSSMTEFNLKPVVKKIRIAGEEEEVVSYQPAQIFAPREREPPSGTRCVFCAEKGVQMNNLRDVDELEAHLYAVHITRMYPTGCFHCGKNVNTSQDLLGHLLQQVLRLPVSKCDQCEFVTLTSQGMQQHKTAFHMQRHIHPYVCGICRKMGFDTPAQLQDHLRQSHTTEPMSTRTPAIAPRNIQLKRPNTEEEMSASKRFHARPTSAFNCRFCEFECESHLVYADHIQNHHGISVNELSDTRVIRSTGNPRFTCKVCEDQRIAFGCDSQAIFYDHVRREHPAKDTSFQCSECALQLLSLSGLHMHLRSGHDITDATTFLAKCPFYSNSKLIRAGLEQGMGPSMSMASVLANTLNHTEGSHSSSSDGRPLTLKLRVPAGPGYYRVSGGTDSTSGSSSSK